MDWKWKGESRKVEKYSVLMSVYEKDNPEYLRMAINSMLNQTVSPNQYVVVKDGPLSDELNNVINEYKNDPIFTIVSSKENNGLAHALNIGLKCCKNELVARMDADDISLPERCEKELKLFEKFEDLVVCGCNIDEFFNDISDIRTSRVVPSQYEEIRKFGRKRQPFNHPTVMYKKSKIQELGGYSKLRRKEDFDLFSRIIVSGAFVRNIDESLYLYRANENNYLRRKSKENMQAALKVYKRHKSRGGCGCLDYIAMCIAEVFFYLLPVKVMKAVSDRVLRKKILI